MALNLENLNEQVASNLESQAPTAKPEIPAPALEQQPVTDELTKLRAENEELKHERTAAKVAAENKAADERIKALVAAAHKPTATPQSGRDAVNRGRAIAKVGGVAPWYGQPADARCEALGVEDSSSVKNSTIEKIIGPKSDSLSALQLMKSDPAAYRRLKQIAIERRLF